MKHMLICEYFKKFTAVPLNEKKNSVLNEDSGFTALIMLEHSFVMI